MYATHNLDHRITGYHWNGQEITDVPVDFSTAAVVGAGLPVDLAYHNGLFYILSWGSVPIYVFDLEGQSQGSIATDWQVAHGSGLAIDPEDGTFTIRTLWLIMPGLPK